SYGTVPVRGHIPPGPRGRGEMDMATLGPLTRDPADLGLILDVLAAPDTQQAPAWRLALPPPRAETLSGYRIAVWPDDPGCPISADVGAGLAGAGAQLCAA